MRLLLVSAIFLLLSGCFLFPSQEPEENKIAEPPPPPPPKPPPAIKPPPIPPQEIPQEVPPAEDAYTFNVTVENVHKSYTLSPGVFVVYKPPASINYLGKLIPPELEPLAEYGNPAPFAAYAENLIGVSSVHVITKPLAPGEKATFTVEVSKDRPRDTQLSGVMMVVQTNDGIALADAITLFTTNDVPLSSATNAQNYDAGTEENEWPGSGFSGGQPDPSKGEENIDNGDPSVPQRPMILHPQIPETAMKVTVVPR
jgi:hypothetical protein